MSHMQVQAGKQGRFLAKGMRQDLLDMRVSIFPHSQLLPQISPCPVADTSQTGTTSERDFPGFLSIGDQLTWVLGRHSPNTTGRICSSASYVAPLGQQCWKQKYIVQNDAVNGGDVEQQGEEGGF